MFNVSLFDPQLLVYITYHTYYVLTVNGFHNFIIFLMVSMNRHKTTLLNINMMVVKLGRLLSNITLCHPQSQFLDFNILLQES